MKTTDYLDRLDLTEADRALIRRTRERQASIDCFDVEAWLASLEPAEEQEAEDAHR